MIVLDASAALLALLGAGDARGAVAAQQLHAPHLIDSEVAQVLRRRAAAKQLGSAEARRLLTAWAGLEVARYAVHPLLDRIWALRANLAAYDAGYVALAEALGVPLLTADARLARAASARCAVTLVAS